MKEAGKVSRREFLAATTAASACLCGLNGCFLFPIAGDTPQIHPPAYEIAASDKQTEIIIHTGKIPDLLSEGTAVKIIDPQARDSIIIANTGGSVFVALSISCSHNGFEVEYEHDKKIFRCISIGHAEFSCDGKVLSGPANKQLNAYPARLQEDKLIVSFVA